MLVLLTACFSGGVESYPVVEGVIVDKDYAHSAIEVEPAGYRVDCGYTIDLKLECGYKFFINPKTKHIPEKYTITVADRRTGCEFDVTVTKEQYLDYDIGSLIVTDMAVRAGELSWCIE